MFYKVIPARPEAHLFQVICTIPRPDSAGQIVSLPAWIPGSYMVRDFAKNIVCIEAHCEGTSVALTQLDKSTWQAAVCDGKLEISYEVYAWDLSVRGAHLDETHGFFNGTSLFLKAHGQEHEPCSVEILPPPAPYGHDWRIATTLERESAELYGFGYYRAADYDELIDHPVEMGTFAVVTFEAGGVPHDVILTGRQDADLERICTDLKPICEQHIAMFGELPPMERYMFLTMVVGDGYGGLEHRSSTALMCSRSDLPHKHQTQIDEGYRTFLGLCSHEYFHTWNVKRIKPEVFFPYDLAAETYTRQLWAFEGITSYYDDIALVRSGVIKPQDYLDALAQTITRVWRGNGRFKQSVADSSFNAWTKFYRQDENAPNAIVSYYTKGSLIALALDITLRRSGKTLDDVMRRLWREFGSPGIGVPERCIEAICSEVAGTDLSELFQRYLYGTEDMPLGQLLDYVGIKSRRRAAESAVDKGGARSNKSDAELTARPDLGVRTAAENGLVKLANVFDEGTAQRAGLSAGDVLVAMDGLQVTPANLESRLGRYEVGARVEIFAFRRDELMRFELELQAPPADTCDLLWDEDVDDATIARRQAWLNIKV